MARYIVLYLSIFASFHFHFVFCLFKSFANTKDASRVDSTTKRINRNKKNCQIDKISFQYNPKKAHIRRQYSASPKINSS